MDHNSLLAPAMDDTQAYVPGRPLLLFFSPVIPSTSGNGTAVRAFLELEALSRRFNVSLCIIILYDLLPAFAGTEHLAEKCQSVTVISGWTPREDIFLALRSFGVTSWDAIHVFRMSMIRYGLHVAEMCAAHSNVTRPALWLDMDDFESKKALREAALHAWLGEQETADSIRVWARLCARGELSAIKRFDRVYLSNPGDVEELSKRANCSKLAVLPNAVRVVAKPFATRGLDGTASLLFVGTLNYVPNVDGVVFFCKKVLPHIRAALRIQLTVTIVGMFPQPAVEALAREHSDVRIKADVPSVDAYYEMADVAIVPLRLGGGTRIKILEAMSFGVPVVSTSIGADGLSLEHEREILIADRPDDFARLCVRLLEDRGLAQRLASRAHQWLLSHHTVENMAAVMHEACIR